MNRPFNLSVFFTSLIFTWLSFFSVSSFAQGGSTSVKIAVIVGSNLGDVDTPPLRYANEDAARMYQVLVSLGHLKKERTILVQNATVKSLTQALFRARGMAEEIQFEHASSHFIFYYSGHGHEQDLELSDGRLSFVQLKDYIQAIPSVSRISMIDACRHPNRQKGVRMGEDFSLTTMVTPMHGYIDIRSSSVGEASLESESLNGSLFTHYLVSALRGSADVNHDGVVSVLEAYEHVYTHTLKHSYQTSHVQHPSLKIDAEGTDKMVLTTLHLADARIQLPSDRARYLVFSLNHQNVVLESMGGAIISLPAGQYLIHRRWHTQTSIHEVDLSMGGYQVIVSQSFKPINPETFAQKGGVVSFKHYRIESALGFKWIPNAADKLGMLGSLTFSYEYQQWLLSMRVLYGYSTLKVINAQGSSHELGVAPGVGYLKHWGRVGILGGIRVDARYHFQTLIHQDTSRAKDNAFFNIKPWHANYASFSFYLEGRFYWSLGHHVSVFLEQNVGLLIRREYVSFDKMAIVPRPVLNTHLGLSFLF